jgi:hypothetical protein
MILREHFIAALVERYGWTLGAELGVWKGRTFKYLLRNCPKLTLIGVDLYLPQPDNAGPQKWVPGEDGHSWNHEKYHTDILKFCAEIGDRALFHRDFTHIVAKEIEDDSLDFVFIDADHSEKSIRRDIGDWMPKIKTTGMIIGHDIDWPTVRKVVAELVPGYSMAPDNLWYRKKTI